MSAIQHDLLVRAGRVFCAETGLDGPGAVAVSGDRIEASGPNVSGEARQVLDFPDALLLPGLVDLHSHPGLSGWKYGVDPDVYILPRGTTTALSQADAGADTWPQFRERIIEGSRTRIRLAIHLARQGESTPDIFLENMDDADVDACVAAIEDGGEHIWGVAINVAPWKCGDNDPREVLGRAIAAAERTGRPLLFGSRRASDWPLSEQLKLLRPGDVVTYCYGKFAESIVNDGRVEDSVWEARERGVLFDLGHGRNSFDLGVAEAGIAQGFLPDTVSADFYIRHVEEDPGHDLPRTISKMMAVGMSETDALERVTARPAQILGLSGEVGTLAPGACADLAVLRWNSDGPPLADVTGATRSGGCWEPVLTVRAGEVVSPPRQT